MNKLVRLLVILGVVLALAAGALYWYLHQDRTHYAANLTLNNIASAQLVNTARDGSAVDIDPASTVTLPYNNDDYQIIYKASDGYADGKYRIRANQTDINITPDLSQEVLKGMLPQEQSAIDKAIEQTYPNFDSIYKIKHQALYGDGLWYGATLSYTGKALFYHDAVGLVLHKKSGQWQVTTKPPLPSLNIYHDPAIPESVARDINHRLRD